MTRPNNTAIARAAERVGLRDPVVVTYERVPVAGYYRRESGYHHILVNAELSALERDRTIYHELEHARQCEHEFGGDGDAYHEAVAEAALAAYDRWGSVCSYELSAREAERMATMAPLT
jgi:hypothetical protein